MSKKLLFNFNREVIQNYTYVKYVGTIITATNTLEKPIKSAILKGSTKYRDIDTGEFLETFEEGRNLELVSVKMPVVTTTNGDGTRTNILSTSEDVVLRGIGDVQDTLDCLTGEVTQHIEEIVLDGSEEWGVDNARFVLKRDDIVPNKWTNGMSNYFIGNRGEITSGNQYDNYFTVNGYGSALYVRDITLFPTPRTQLNEFKTWLNERSVQGNPVILQYISTKELIKTVDLSILDQNGNKVSSISSFNDTTHVMASSETIPPTFEGYLATKEVE